MSSQQPTLAILGATGGCANSALVHALRAGTNVICLVRTPAKLTDLLLSQGITQQIMSSQLTTIAGNALNPKDVKTLLTANNTPDYLVSDILTGLGGTPRLQFSFQPVTIDQPDICGDAAQILVAALKELYTEQPALAQRKPRLAMVSTTGITSGPEDVPFGFRILYHWLLATPHIDKRVMESTFRDNFAGKDGQTAVFGGLVGVRPALLTGGVNVNEGKGWDKLTTGREAAPALGYFISRADVGQWLWVNVLSDEERRKQWDNDMITLCN